MISFVLMNNYAGLILLAACSTKKLAQTFSRMLSFYGSEDGDGAPTISGEEQIRQTTETIAIFVAR